MKRRTILVVDDSPEDREMVRHHLLRSGGEGYTVREEELGEAALDTCLADPPDCVLLDYHLPDVNGLEFLAALRDRLPFGVPLVMLTGQEDREVAVAALEQGAQDYLIKGSISPSALVRVIDNAVEKWRIQRELIEQRAALELRNRQLETYASVIAHDLRNPLNTIFMSANFLLELLPPEERGTERIQLEIIRRSVERTNRLVEDLLDVARIEVGQLHLERHPEAVVPLVRDALDLHTLAAVNKGVTLRQEVEEALPQVLADQHQVLRVFQNLIENALKFTPAGGQITVRANGDGEFVWFRVEDTGAGIPPNVLPHVFDRFWKARAADRKGLGLGLAIVRGIVEAHGGTICVDSREGEGTTFRFALPSVAVDENRADAPPCPEHSTTLGAR